LINIYEPEESSKNRVKFQRRATTHCYIGELSVPLLQHTGTAGSQHWTPGADWRCNNGRKHFSYSWFHGALQTKSRAWQLRVQSKSLWLPEDNSYY